MRLKLFLLVLFFYTITKAQPGADLKEFINKNNTAIRTVQKNMLRENNVVFITSFKEILKNQAAAVKLYGSDKSKSSYFASIVRTECLAFLKDHSKGSVEYFEINDSEKTFLKTGIEKNAGILSSVETQQIEKLNALDPQSLNNLNLTIQ